MLAFKNIWLVSNAQRNISGLVSLIDIKPTIIELLNIPSPNGFSLLANITGKQHKVPTRTDFFMETDFSPEAIRSVHPETRQVLFQGIEYFEINPQNARILVRNDMLRLIVSSKQYANRRGNWILALYPQPKKGMIPILVNLKTGQ